MSLRSEVVEALRSSGRWNVEDHLGRIVVEGNDSDRVIIWEVSDAELAALVADRRSSAKRAYGGGSSALDLLVVHLFEALDTFDGDRGRLVHSAESGLIVE